MLWKSHLSVLSWYNTSVRSWSDRSVQTAWTETETEPMGLEKCRTGPTSESLRWDRDCDRNVGPVQTEVVHPWTPHHGVDSANFLDDLLRICFAEADYVNQLCPGSETIQRINHHFGDRAESLKLISFYERKGMPGVGVSSIIISSNPM